MKLKITLLAFTYLLNFFPLPTAHKIPVGNKSSRSVAIPKAAKKLIASYPEYLSGYAENQVIFKDGTKMTWDDGIPNKTVEQVLAKPDLKDMFAQTYTKGKMDGLPAKNFDPGRTRSEPFFLKMYGSTKADVEKNLVEITWCPKLVGQKVMVTKINGVNKKFIEVSKELDEHPELKKYLTDIAGTFTWRYIAGTTRQSMHSFGMTVDINTDYSDYWEWACKCVTENSAFTYQNRIPQPIVDIFEKHGFIWGGKWYHFDTMHFEYRPELM